MKVGINGWFWGQLDTGLGQYTTYLAAALAQADVGEIVIICPQRKQLAVSNEPFAVNHSPFTIHHTLRGAHATPFTISHSPLSRLWFEQVTFPRLCHKLMIDVAFVPHPGMPRQPQHPTLTTLHDLTPWLFPAYQNHAMLRLYMKLVAAALPRAHHLLTDSQASRSDMVTHLSLPPKRITVIYPAAAPHFHTLPTTETINQVRQRYDLPEQFILYLGGYGVHKNVTTLLSGYAKLPASLRQTFPLVLAGRLPTHSNKLYDNPRSHVQALELTNHVHLPGPIAEPDKPALFAAATLFTFPSWREGFGLPVLEALHMGTPVLTSHTSSLPEVAGDAATLLPPDTPDAWTEAIAHLSTHPETREIWRERGRIQAQTFSWDAAAHQLWPLFAAAAGEQ